jgi:hypothetical protein
MPPSSVVDRRHLYQAIRAQGRLRKIERLLSINNLESIGGNSSVGFKKAGGNSTFSANFWGQLLGKLPPVAPGLDRKAKVGLE